MGRMDYLCVFELWTLLSNFSKKGSKGYLSDIS